MCVALPLFVLFRLNVSISCQRVGELDKDTVEWAFQLTKANMQALYVSDVMIVTYCIST